MVLLKEKNKLLQAQLDAAEAMREAAVSRAESEVKIQMQTKVDEAFDKGYAKCKESMEDMQKMMKAMRES